MNGYNSNDFAAILQRGGQFFAKKKEDASVSETFSKIIIVILLKSNTPSPPPPPTPNTSPPHPHPWEGRKIFLTIMSYISMTIW